ncbi:MAG: glycoside hydrolase family 88 protein [Verrucomicrobiota bacterium]
MNVIGKISNHPTFAKKSAQDASRDKAFEMCVSKVRNNIKLLADEPKSAAWAVDGNYFNFKEGFFEIGNWTSSFFTGMALIAWHETEDEYFLKQTLRLAPAYREKACVRFLDMHHDAGFLYSLYSVALYKLTGDQAHREVGLAAARALAQRFNETGGFIRAWGRLDEPEGQIAEGFVRTDNMAIIDCLMNLPLLYWASKETSNKQFYDIAVRHADMVVKNFIRPDGSVIHAYRFDLKTGQPLGPENYCGYSVDSYWARGATWAVYGFALSYSYTGDKKYLDAAVKVARKFVEQLDAEWVPMWDFRLLANVSPVRDASAAAVMICAIQELEQLNAADKQLIDAKDALLRRLCSQDYLDGNPNCLGILKCGYGSRVAYSSWGDYFFMEALARELFQIQPWW